MIEKNSKTFFKIFSIIILISIIASFYRYIIIKDINFFTDEEAFNNSLLE